MDVFKNKKSGESLVYFILGLFIFRKLTLTARYCIVLVCFVPAQGWSTEKCVSVGFIIIVYDLKYVQGSHLHLD